MIDHVTTDAFNKNMKEFRDEITDLKLLIAELPKKISDDIDNKYVRKDEFKSVKKVVYGAIAAVLLGAGGILGTIVVKAIEAGWTS